MCRHFFLTPDFKDETFLKDEISYPGIAEVVEETLDRMPGYTLGSVDELLDMDRRSRETARQACAQRGNYVRL